MVLGLALSSSAFMAPQPLGSLRPSAPQLRSPLSPLGSLRRKTAVQSLKAVDMATAQAAMDALHHAAVAGAALPDPSALQHADMQQAMDGIQMLFAAAEEAVKEDKPGVFGQFVNVIEGCLTTLHTVLKAAGVPGAWGVSIASFTILIKSLTYPLNYKQMASTFALQKVQPKIKALQARYQNDPETMNQKMAELYRDENVNPLAGCLPTLVQIPVFIGLYRSVLDLAKKDLLEESFLWIPSLEGPVGDYNPSTGLPVDGTAWLFKGWVDGHPAMGWETTFAYLSIPIILVITQSLSQKIIQPPPSDDPAQQQTQQILKFLPLMIGWFALNVPAGLGVYWIANNALSTFQQWYIRQQFKDEMPAPAGAASSSAPAAPAATQTKAVATPVEPAGFSAAPKKAVAEPEPEVSEEDDEPQEETKSMKKKRAKALKNKKK